MRSTEDRLARLEVGLEASLAQTTSTEKLLTARLEAALHEAEVVNQLSDKALEKAAEAQRQINIRQNEFRAALEDQSKRVELSMLPRREFDAQHTAMLDALRRSREILDNGLTQLREDLGQLRTDVAVGPPGLSLLTSRVDTSSGETQGKAAGLAVFIAVGGLLVAIVSLVIVIAVRLG